VRARRLLAREGQRGIGAAARRGDSPGSADGSHLSAASASAEELITAIRLEARHAHSRRHLKALQDLSRARINTPQIAIVTFQGAVPELSIIPGDPRDEAVGRDSPDAQEERLIEALTKVDAHGDVEPMLLKPCILRSRRRLG
jgi:hypothetical protein